MAATLATGAIKPVLPFLSYLATPLLSLPPVLALHLASHPSPSPLSLLSDPLTHPLHLPVIFTTVSIPVIYLAGHLSGNVSWVDRLWPFFTPFCSALTLLWLVYNPGAGVFAHNIPRLAVMFAVQLIWCARLTSNAVRRGFYDLTGEDYRYTVVRQIVPRWMWSFIHLVVVAISQPVLLLALSLPLYAVLSFPPSELSRGLFGLNISLGKVQHLGVLASSTAPASTPILTLNDVLVAVFALTCVFVEYRVDNAMYAYQTSKYAAMDDPNVQIVHPPKSDPVQTNPTFPQPSAYPASHHPGFPVHSWWRFSRHGNFAAEQLFWVGQALFAAAAASPSDVTLSGIPGGTGGIWGPCLALSLLFCCSTALTEWISAQKYPLYRTYKGLVGQFLPVETAFLFLWGTIRGTRQAGWEKLESPPLAHSERGGEQSRPGGSAGAGYGSVGGSGAAAK